MSLVLLQAPFVYAYYEVAQITDKRVVDLNDLPIGKLTAEYVAFHSRNIGARIFTKTGAEEAPGDVWYVEEDAWHGAWIRRPGTNLFDGTMVKGGQVTTFVLEIRRSGNDIIAKRYKSSDNRLDLTSPEMMYAGRLRNLEIQGTYVGGIWTARILR